MLNSLEFMKFFGRYFFLLQILNLSEKKVTILLGVDGFKLHNVVADGFSLQQFETSHFCLGLVYKQC